MKTKLMKAVILLAVVTFIFSSQRNRETEPDIVLSNIEALASGEYTYMNCYDIGSLDCPINNSKVFYIYWSR